MGLELSEVGRDHFLAAVGALPSPVSIQTSVISGLSTHNSSRLGSLDGQAVGLDRGARAGSLCLLVLALDLGIVSTS